MTFMQVSAAFGYVFASFGGLFNFDSKKYQHQLKYVLIAGCVIGLLIIGYFGYEWYKISQDQSAQSLFSTDVSAFGKIKKTEDYENMVTQLQMDHAAKSGSHFAPYFTAYEVDALLQLGKKSEALHALDDVIHALSSSNPTLNLFKTKRALLKLDLEDEQLKKDGMIELEQLAQDTKNKDRDVAQFYLGLHYYVADKLDDAKKVWGELVAQNSDTKNPSPWAEQAKQRLESLA